MTREQAFLVTMTYAIVAQAALQEGGEPIDEVSRRRIERTAEAISANMDLVDEAIKYLLREPL